MDDTGRAARRHAVRSKVQSGLSIAAPGMKIAQISDILARAESQYVETKKLDPVRTMDAVDCGIGSCDEEQVA